MSSNLNSAAAAGTTIRSLIPARIDRLHWAPFHTRMVMALGTAWVLDGIEITIAGAMAAVLTDKATPRPQRRPRSARSPPSTCSVRSSAHCSSASCPTRSAARTSSS